MQLRLRAMRFGRKRRILDIHNVVSNRSSQETYRSSRVSQLRSIVSYKNVRSWLVDNLRNYCNTTSLHGFNYITLKGITYRERIFWISVVVISLIVAVVLVFLSWMWTREMPTVTVIESSHFPTWNIPFPAVTICNFNKISKLKATSMAQTMIRPDNITQDELLKLFRLTLYFSFSVNHSRLEFQKLNSVLLKNNITAAELSEKLAPDCLDMISRCKWKGTNTRCDSLFQRVNTAEGACCAFNYFGLSTNNFPKKLAYQVPRRPYRVTGCGYATGLSVILNPITTDYFATYYSSFGFRLLIHDAYNVPDENAETKVVTSTRESFVRITPESTYATSDIRDMNLDLRNCLFSNERTLMSLQRYTFVNCMYECRITMLYKICGCIPSNLPNNGSFPICDLLQIYCVIENREIFSRALPTSVQTLSVVNDTKRFPCDCIPDCEVNQYPSEITMGTLNIKSEFNEVNIEANSAVVSGDDKILLHVFFSDLMSTRYRKEIYENWLSTLASFGGLLGLIMGFSIVTAFEFIYFLTFRPVFNYFKEF